ncbi:MAG: hypothetical protein WB689_25655 [Xanthobacteraceae bacterium]
MTVFGDDPRDLAKTLGEMERTARERCNFNQVEARQRFAEYLSHDARFREYDPGRLIERVMEARSCGRTLDLDDPYLQRGGQKRPLSF